MPCLVGPHLPASDANGRRRMAVGIADEGVLEKMPGRMPDIRYTDRKKRQKIS